jgi:glycerophosphoryl diester phosphodiesterase
MRFVWKRDTKKRTAGTSLSSTCPDPARQTRVIAHRGASGYLPEHTAVAKTLAYGLGADFLEQDVVATADGVLVVLHDIFLDDVSDVAVRFPDKRRDDGHFYVIDFTFAELQTLSLRERRSPGSSGPLYPTRFPFDSGLFRIVRFEEEVRLIAGLNRATGRKVGLYPEIKEPAWHERHGIDLAQRVVQTLEDTRDLVSGPVFVQSFDRDALNGPAWSGGCPWPRIQLLELADAKALDSRPGELEAIAGYAAGVGLPFETLIDRSGQGRLRPSPLADALAEAGLLIHPYTMRRDAPPAGGIDYWSALRFLIRELAVDAIFCDQPDDAIRLRSGTGA